MVPLILGKPHKAMNKAKAKQLKKQQNPSVAQLLFCRKTVSDEGYPRDTLEVKVLIRNSECKNMEHRLFTPVHSVMGCLMALSCHV